MPGTVMNIADLQNETLRFMMLMICNVTAVLGLLSALTSEWFLVGCFIRNVQSKLSPTILIGQEMFIV